MKEFLAEKLAEIQADKGGSLNSGGGDLADSTNRLLHAIFLDKLEAGAKDDKKLAVFKKLYEQYLAKEEGKSGKLPEFNEFFGKFYNLIAQSKSFGAESKEKLASVIASSASRMEEISGEYRCHFSKWSAVDYQRAVQQK